MIGRIFACSAIGLFAAACANTGASQQRAAVDSAGDGSFVLTRLDSPRLPAGKCGMILWTLDAKRPTPIFRYISGEMAQIEVDGAVIDLTLGEADGAADFGVFERQVFISDQGYDARLTVEFGPGFDGGLYLERGSLSVKSSNGWELIAPTAGIAGCRRG